ncbi:MAG: ABC transporter ATP-binding protein [Tatlockia sp.]|nr:ABC transporter ATP-binding protein [Tatlockia sp.]
MFKPFQTKDSSLLLLPQTIGSIIWHFLKPYKAAVVAFILLATLAGCWGPFNSLLIKILINTLVSNPINSGFSLAWTAGLLVLNFIVFDNITWRSIAYLNCKFEPLIKNQIISQSFDYVLGSSHQYFQNNLSGRVANQITMLADNIERILHRISADFIRGTSVLIVALVTMYFVNPRFSYTLIIWFVVFSAISLFLSKYLIAFSDKLAESESMNSGELVDSISNATNVRIFARRLYEVARLDEALLITKEKFQKNELFLLMVHSIQGFLIAIMMGFMVYFLIQLYGRHLISIGDFALILGLSMEVGHISWYTMSQVDEFNQALGKAKQSLSCLLVPHEIQDENEANSLVINQGKIVFSQVKFQYQGTETLFQNKSVTIEAGQKVGLVGYSGSGKSTFVNLILRLYDVVDGQILIDDQDLRDVSQESLRANITLIPQEPTLFHRSLMENIRYSRIEASDAEVVLAAQKAHSHEFISKMSEGYDSLVGERGVKLSGGQRQRIAIARAILKNAPILILDEATSQLDSVTEANIQESLWELMQGKTTLVIAHRLSTLLHMDRILVFDEGHIVEDGSHYELLKQKGLYKALWDAQVGGFLPDKKSTPET